MKEDEKKRAFESEAIILPALRMVLNEPKAANTILSPEPLSSHKKPINRAVVVKLINKLSRKD